MKKHTQKKTIKKIKFIHEKITIPQDIELSFEKVEDYKLIDIGVLRLDTGANISEDLSSQDWRRYLAWVESGNTAQPQYTLSERRANRWRELQKKCMNVCEGGVTTSLKVVDSTESAKHLYNSHISDVERGSIETSFKIINKDDSEVDLNVVELKAMHANASKLYNLAFKNASAIKAIIDVSENPESVDINVGWPTTPYNGV